ncbi:MAG: YraN family protein [Flavobacterium nitrogenifigens]|uniref:YraN family protein n=1 Tax=Flavobacterium nitrogenifigens TaxID=1617283 RepID=UPI0028096DFA|nr:YraN family protein [Flavobacterium nitrogenifigens]MDQ8011837.1 YraN family protein [Flavobacterium nitrogenifigens]
MAEHNDLGKLGEDLAAAHLEENGYSILERNFVIQKAEIDIIAQKDAVLAIVEVKTRSSLDFGSPQDFVKHKKIQLLIKAVNAYINDREKDFQEDLEIRFDIIAVHKDGESFAIEHLTDAFYHF